MDGSVDSPVRPKYTAAQRKKMNECRHRCDCFGRQLGNAPFLELMRASRRSQTYATLDAGVLQSSTLPLFHSPDSLPAKKKDARFASFFE